MLPPWRGCLGSLATSCARAWGSSKERSVCCRSRLPTHPGGRHGGCAYSAPSVGKAASRSAGCSTGSSARSARTAPSRTTGCSTNSSSTPSGPSAHARCSMATTACSSTPLSATSRPARGGAAMPTKDASQARRAPMSGSPKTAGARQAQALPGLPPGRRAKPLLRSAWSRRQEHHLHPRRLNPHPADCWAGGRLSARHQGLPHTAVQLQRRRHSGCRAG
jgi:hypothetical protein